MRESLPFPFCLRLPRGEHRVILLFVLLTAIVGVASAWGPPIGGSSEAREAHVIRLMGETGDYLLPLRNGLVPSKPPLFHWIGVLVSKITTSWGPGSARIPSLLAAAGLLWLAMVTAYQFGKEIRPNQALRYSLWAGVVLSTTYEFERMRTQAMVDMVFSLFVGLAIAPIWYRCVLSERPQLREIDFSALFFFSGLAVLAKGPAGLILPILFVIPLLVMPLGWREAMQVLIKPRFGWILFGIVATPWYVLSALRENEAFIGRQLLFENVRRFLGGEHVNRQPWWFYLPTFLRSGPPWSFIFIWIAARLMRRGLSKSEAGTHFSERMKSSVYAIVLLFIFFSLAEGKRGSYLLPLYPWISLVIVPAVIQLVDSQSARTLSIARTWICRLLVALVVLLGALLAFVELLPVVGLSVGGEWGALAQSWIHSRMIVLALGWGMSVIGLRLLYILRQQSSTSFFLIALVFITTLSLVISIGFTVRNHFKDFALIAGNINQRVMDAPLQAVRDVRDEYFDGVLYYLRRPVQLVAPSKFRESCSGYVLVRSDHFADLSDMQRARAHIVAQYSEIDDRLAKRESIRTLLIRCDESAS